MNKNFTDIRRGIAQITNKPFEVISGVVVEGSINEEEHTCSIIGIDGTTTFDVRLSAIATASMGLILVPKDNSHVVAASIDGPGSCTIIKYHELQSIKLVLGTNEIEILENKTTIKQGEWQCVVEDNKLSIKNSSESLHTLIKDLLTAIKNITVSTASGTSSVPVNLIDFTNLNTRFNNLLTT